MSNEPHGAGSSPSIAREMPAAVYIVLALRVWLSDAGFVDMLIGE